MTYLNHPRILFFGSICSNLALPQKVTLRTKAPPIIAYRQIRKSMNMCDLSQVNHDITVKMCDLSKFNNEIIEKQRQTGSLPQIWLHSKFNLFRIKASSKARLFSLLGSLRHGSCKVVHHLDHKTYTGRLNLGTCSHSNKKYKVSK